MGDRPATPPLAFTSHTPPPLEPQRRPIAEASKPTNNSKEKRRRKGREKCGERGAGTRCLPYATLEKEEG